VKLVSENLGEAAKFDRMAEDAGSPALRKALQDQAAAYRILAARRAADQDLSPANIPAARAQPPLAQQQQSNSGE
jgi:hypothetical protein